MEKNEIINGFRVVSARESRELGGTLWELRHEKTGAVLYWTQNGEENKLFSVTFKTLPKDDTGVFHILEHSVLCGSESFPVKEPFLDLLKSSLNTFLNAFTAPDHTSYPVSSKNEKDFMNLTRVYLDAVFRPALLTNELIFMQEGHRIDFGADAPCFNGVVFNEMKGATASDFSRLWTVLIRGLYPDTCYGYNSGGEPEAIPTLTYEDFLASYREFYHPSNAIFYLDGDLPVDKVLPLIASYLDGYEKNDTPHEIAMQEPLPSRRIEDTYECGKEEPTENRTHLCFAKLAGRFDDRKRLEALEVLRLYLFDSNEAPLKCALMQTGLVKDVDFDVSAWRLQAVVLLTLLGTEDQHRGKLLDTLRSAVNELLAGGLDPDDLSAAIDQMEIGMRCRSEPQGLERAELLIRSRLYGGDPLLYLENENVVKDLRDAIGTDYYTRLVREFFLDDANTVEVVLRPDPEKGEKDRECEEALLQKTLDAMTPDERASEEEKFARFREWQETPDSPEAKSTLPGLTLADVKRLPEKTETEIKTCGGRDVLFHPCFTNGVDRVALYFNIADQPLDELSALSFMTQLFGELPTENYSGELLHREYKRMFGDLSTDVLPVPEPGARDSTPLYFAAVYTALSGKLPEALSLAAEILLRTKFDDKERIRNILTQTRENQYRNICYSGSRPAAIRALASGSAEYAVRDAVAGVGYYIWLKEFEEDFEARADEFIAFASSVAGRLFTLDRMKLSETSDEYRDACFCRLSEFSEGESCACEKMKIPRRSAEKEAFIIPGGVSYAAECATLQTLDTEECGDMDVLSNILTLDHLWNEIRVRGGAYGCHCSLSELTGLQFTSYRDPDPARSLGIYADTSDYIRRFIESGESIENYIISASAEPLLGPRERGRIADLRILGGIDYDYVCRRREELLGTKTDSLEAYGELFDKATERASRCVIGSRDAIEKLGDRWKVSEL
ncbi:MAG: insulinase family protein [Clostridia bacterium]|nr:insulinase family protein [Clostridia bacterium]